MAAFRAICGISQRMMNNMLRLPSRSFLRILAARSLLLPELKVKCPITLKNSVTETKGVPQNRCDQAQHRKGGAVTERTRREYAMCSILRSIGSSVCIWTRFLDALASTVAWIEEGGTHGRDERDAPRGDVLR